MRLLRDLSRLPIECHGAERWIEGALDITTRQGVTVYDGLDLALAVATKCRVVTAEQPRSDRTL
jgi:predicted nucleic acid-binding protein